MWVDNSKPNHRKGIFKDDIWPLVSDGVMPLSFGSDGVRRYETYYDSRQQLLGVCRVERRRLHLTGSCHQWYKMHSHWEDNSLQQFESLIYNSCWVEHFIITQTSRYRWFGSGLDFAADAVGVQDIGSGGGQLYSVEELGVYRTEGGNSQLSWLRPVIL